MAENIRLEEISHPYDDINNLKDMQDILNDSTYGTVPKEATIDELKVKMTNENYAKLKLLINTKYTHVDDNLIAVESVKLRKRIISKDGELYLRTTGSRVKPIKFGNHNYKAVKITQNKGTELLKLNTLLGYGMSTQDEYYKMLIGEKQVKETSFESTETLRKSVAFAHDDMTITSTPLRTIEDIVRPLRPEQLEQSKELSDVLTDEDRQTIVKYLDFIQKNYDKKIQLVNDIERHKKLLSNAEK
jgi:hypothetical protein